MHFVGDMDTMTVESYHATREEAEREAVRLNRENVESCDRAERGS